jgi:hypothetical protein
MKHLQKRPDPPGTATSTTRPRGADDRYQP